MLKGGGPTLTPVGSLTRRQLFWAVLCLLGIPVLLWIGIMDLWQGFHGGLLYIPSRRGGFYFEWATEPADFVVAAVIDIIVMLSGIVLWLFQFGQFGRWLSLRSR